LVNLYSEIGMDHAKLLVDYFLLNLNTNPVVFMNKLLETSKRFKDNKVMFKEGKLVEYKEIEITL
jgi:hypothetical protein